MDIKGFDKAKVLYALWLHSQEQGMSFLGRYPMTEDKCRKILEQQTYIDYLGGRVIKVDMSGDHLDLRLYDRDNGEGAGEYAILEYLTRP